MSRSSFPRPLAWHLLSVRKRTSSGAPVAAVTAVTTLLIAAALVPVIAIATEVRAQQSGTGILSQISVVTLDESSESPALTTRIREQIEGTAGVESVVADLSVGIYAGGDGTWSTTIHTANPANLPPGIVAVPEGDEIIVPASIDGVDLASFVGAPLALEYTVASGEQQGELRELSLEVIGSYDPSWQGYGPQSIIGSEERTTELLAARAGVSATDYLEKHGVATLIVTAANAGAVDSVTAALRNLGLDARPARDELGELPGVIAAFPVLIAIVAAVAGVILVLLVTSIVRGALARRAREFGLLRTRGWSVGDIRRLVVIDLGTAAVAGSLVGTLIGAVMGVAVNSMVSGGEAALQPAGSAVALALLTLAVSPPILAVAIGLTASRRALRTDPYLALVEVA